MNTNNAILPEVVAIVPLIPQVLPVAKNLYRDRNVLPSEVLDFAKRTQPIHLARLDDPNDPLIKTGKDGSRTLFLLWGHPKNPLDTNFLVAMVCPEQKDEHGRSMFKPSLMLRGPLANVMVIGGMSCCGAALQTHWSQVFEGNIPAIDDARIPVAGLPDPEHADWLKGKVHLAKSQAGLQSLHHIAMDVLAHRLPNDSRFKHNCGSHQDYDGYAADARKLTL